MSTTIVTGNTVAHSSTLAARCLSLIAREQQRQRAVADLGMESTIVEPSHDQTLVVMVSTLNGQDVTGLIGMDGRLLADVVTEAIQAVAAEGGLPVEDVWWRPVKELSDRPAGLLIRSAARIRRTCPASSLDVAAAVEVLRYVSRAVMPKAGDHGLVVEALKAKIRNFLVEYGQSPKRGMLVTDSAEAVYRLIVHGIAEYTGRNVGEIGRTTTMTLFGNTLPERRHSIIQIVNGITYAVDPNWINK